MKTDICYVISHGFAARMLLQTGLVTQLTRRGRRVALIVPDADDENIQELRQNAGISIHQCLEKNSLWLEDYEFRRKYYLEDIRANTALWEKHIRATRFNTSKHPWRWIRPYFYYAIYRLISIFPLIRENFRKNEKRHLKSSEIGQLLDTIDPRLVVATYPVNRLEAKVLFAAREKKIATLIHLLSWDNITCKGIFPVDADYYIAWGEIMRKELETYYQPAPEKVFVCGVPHFDHHLLIQENPDYSKVLRDLGLHPDKPYLFVAMSSPRFAPKEIDIVEWLAQKIESNYFGPELQLVVRPHPQNVSGRMADKSWLERLDRLQSRRIAVDYPLLNRSKMRWSMKQNDMDRLSNLLVGCSLCINSGSTVSIDALTVDKPVILTSFDGEIQLPYWQSARRLIDYPHLKKLVKLGGVRVATSFDTLTHNIIEYQKDPQRDLAARKHTLHRQCFKSDGSATERSLEALLSILDTVETGSQPKKVIP